MVPDQFYQELSEKTNGRNTVMVVRVAATMERHTSFVPCVTERFGRIAVSRQTINILKHHDTIIQQHSDGQRHSYQGKTIDSDTKSVEEVESRIDRNRYGKCDKKHQPHILQEKPKNEHSQ